jgi:SAM-dependent methyltransferase
VDDSEANLDAATVESFGHEWTRFSSFSAEAIEAGGREYFADLLPDETLRGAHVLDVGCGSGRWSTYLSRRAAFVDAADPSQAAIVAAAATRALPNVRVVHAGVMSLPYADASFDVVASVGVLHHLPDTAGAIAHLARFVRPGGRIYLYLYYRLEGRPWPYRAAFQLSRGLRRVISALPQRLKTIASDAAAVAIYLPCVTAARIARAIAPRSRVYEAIPLHYYVDKPWRIMRNDALDRLGTPLEQRFSRAEITTMLERAGFSDIRFGDAMPRWRVVARRNSQP